MPIERTMNTTTILCSLVVFVILQHYQITEAHGYESKQNITGKLKNTHKQNNVLSNWNPVSRPNSPNWIQISVKLTRIERWNSLDMPWTDLLIRWQFICFWCKMYVHNWRYKNHSIYWITSLMLIWFHFVGNKCAVTPYLGYTMILFPFAMDYIDTFYYVDASIEGIFTVWLM